MLPDRVSNPGPLTYESGALPIALRGPAAAVVIGALRVYFLIWIKYGSKCCAVTTYSVFAVSSTNGNTCYIVV